MSFADRWVLDVSPSNACAARSFTGQLRGRRTTRTTTVAVCTADRSTRARLLSPAVMASPTSPMPCKWPRALGQEVSVSGGGQDVAGRATTGAQPRDAAAWTRDDRPRRWKPGNRRPDTRRRTWLVDTQVRSRARQPASRRDRGRGNASDLRLERFSTGCSVRLQADLVKSDTSGGPVKSGRSRTLHGDENRSRLPDEGASGQRHEHDTKVHTRRRPALAQIVPASADVGTASEPS